MHSRTRIYEGVVILYIDHEEQTACIYTNTLRFYNIIAKDKSKVGILECPTQSAPRAEKLFGGGVVYQQYYIELINATGITDTYFPIALNILP